MIRPGFRELRKRAIVGPDDRNWMSDKEESGHDPSV